MKLDLTNLGSQAVEVAEFNVPIAKVVVQSSLEQLNLWWVTILCPQTFLNVIANMSVDGSTLLLIAIRCNLSHKTSLLKTELKCMT